MKNKYLKFLVSFLLIFVLIGRVNASLTCGMETTPVTIIEDGLEDAGFDVKLPLCYIDYSKGPAGYSVYGDGHSSYSDAYDSGFWTEVYYLEDMDGKGVHLEEVPRCTSSLRRVVATSSCTYTKPKTHHSLTCGGITTESTCKSYSNCTWTAPDEANGVTGGCSGGYAYNYYDCKSNGVAYGTENESGTCSASWDYNGGVVTSNVNAVAACNSANGVSNCSCSNVVYKLECPYYKCETRYKTISACTAKFHLEGPNGENIPVYCVNPSQGFIRRADNYEVDHDFDVTKCANSYSTIDCGFANILIEGAYYDVNDTAINTALRLWGAHSGQTGYTTSGVANAIGESCDIPQYFRKDPDTDEYVNVYKYTEDFIMAKLYDTAVTYGHIPEESSAFSKASIEKDEFYKLTKITCDSPLNELTTRKNMLGVMCGESKEYRYAFMLFFNTVIGNKYMKEHLSALYLDDPGSKPHTAELVTETPLIGETQTKVVVEYEHEDFWDYVRQEEIDCYHLDEIEVIDGVDKQTVIDMILPYCQVKTRLVGPDGRTVVDEDGNVVDAEQMDVCIKDEGCYVLYREIALCDIASSGGNNITIEVTYQRQKQGLSIIKYQSCDDADTNQVMFSYFDEETTEELIDGGWGDWEETGRTTVTDSFAVLNYNCSGNCTNLELRTTGNNKCSNDLNNYDGVYGYTVKDPSLRCILNVKEESVKNSYDYSAYFGVNTNFCRVYCSDEIEYEVADKTRAISGRLFKYNIEFAATGSTKANYMISSIVKEKRTCVSEIYYAHLPESVNWKDIYGLTDEEWNSLSGTNLTFANLYRILKAKAENDEGGRAENMNQILYDLYNCNLYKPNNIPSSVKQPQNNTYGNLYTRANTIFGKDNQYGLNTDATGHVKGDGAKNASSVKYGFGPEISTYDGTNMVNTHTRLSSVTNTSVLTGNVGGIGYCKNETGKICYQYNPADDDGSYNYPSESTKTLQYTFKGNNIRVPVNDYAKFEVTTNVNFYNHNYYQAAWGDGSIVKGRNYDDLLTLDAYSYPIDQEAYNNEACNVALETGTLVDEHRCTVKQEIKPLLFYRAAVNDQFTSKVGKETFTCYVDVKPPTTRKENNGTIYRNVEMSDMFPSTNGTPASGTNWSQDYGLEAYRKITESAADFGDGTKYLQYSITLNPTQIKALREYNSKGGNRVYMNESIYNCTKNDGYYTNCTSYFLDILRGKSKEYERGSFGTIDINYMTGESKKDRLY